MELRMAKDFDIMAKTLVGKMTTKTIEVELFHLHLLECQQFERFINIRWNLRMTTKKKQCCQDTLETKRKDGEL